MHLWPSTMLRDSFKHAYLKKLEWNLSRMKSEKKSSSSTEEKLLDSEEGEVNGEVAGTKSPTPQAPNGFLLLCNEILLLLSCCYCCFCCGACIENEN
ncbi:uncharacterized protein LOC107421463 [Ziziphus jujuba]|uniref:Uncharacterized protein LOC107421463 n=1 Tax=Ziziphus jujuba TaxID=326968 RepID=A0ABM3IEE6_ZIZJJ|nr:uncharacterized protein LOC107421463 [Ziziphus jujuba]